MSDRLLVERAMDDVEVRPFTLDEFHGRRRRAQRNRRIGKGLVGMVVAALATAGAFRAVALDDDGTKVTSDDEAPAELRSYAGSWEAEGAFGTKATMDLRVVARNQATIAVHLGSTTLCNTGPGDLTGSGRLELDEQRRTAVPSLVVEAALVCPDVRPTEPRSPAAERELLDSIVHVRFLHDPVADTLVAYIGNDELLWYREGDEPDTADPLSIPGRVADAINERDAEAFLALFAPDGVFDPRVRFRDGPRSFRTDLPVFERPLVEAWMALNDAWGFEVGVGRCTDLTGAPPPDASSVSVSIECDVAARWTTLSLEIHETWHFEQRATRIVWLSHDQVDLDPPERTEPFGQPGLRAWEAWLRDTQPEDADAWFAFGDPRYALRVIEIDGYELKSEELPYHPAYADEIKASIDEYLEEQ